MLTNQHAWYTDAVVYYRGWNSGRVRVDGFAVSGSDKMDDKYLFSGVQKTKWGGGGGGGFKSWVYWCFTSHSTIFQSYMWRHRCTGGLKTLYLRSGFQRHSNFAGFFNVPVIHRHGTNLFIRWFRHTAPLVAFCDTLGYSGRILDLNPRALTWGWGFRKNLGSGDVANKSEGG